MPDPKGLAEAIASDLEAVGFTINFHTAGWRTGYLADEAVGKYAMWLLGWTCDWPGPDNFLNTAFFHFDGDEPNPEFAYGPPELKTAFDTASRRPTMPTAQAAWDEAQDILAADLPTVPLVHSKPPAAASADSQGLPGRRQPERAAVSASGWTASHALAAHRAATADTLQSPGALGPRGGSLHPDEATTHRAEVHRPHGCSRRSRSCSACPSSSSRSSTCCRATRSRPSSASTRRRSCRRADPGPHGPRQAALGAVPHLPRPARSRATSARASSTTAGRRRAPARASRRPSS